MVDGKVAWRVGARAGNWAAMSVCSTGLRSVDSKASSWAASKVSLMGGMRAVWKVCSLVDEKAHGMAARLVDERAQRMAE